MEFNSEEYYKYLAQQEQKNKKEKPKNKGLTVFICIVFAVLLIGVASTIALIIANNIKPASAVASGGSSQTEQDKASDIATLDDNALSPEKDDGKNDISISFKAQPKKELSSVQIAKNSQNCVVGITIYTTNGILQSEASGIVIGTNKAKTKTYVATCAHVISEKASDGKDYVYKIRNADGNEYSAAVVGYDKSNDVGVLSIKKAGFKTAQFADSSSVLAGQTVMSVGNPGGSEFYGSITKGIVSATDRLVETEDATIRCIQHDSAINPGNSGGALFNVYGQIIGMNYSKVTDTEYEGMGFAIPSKTVLAKVKDIISNGTKTAGAKLGVKYFVSASYVYDGYKQLIISEIDEGSDLNGKVEAGEFIVAVNGSKIKDQYTLIEKINSLSPGDTIKLTIASKNSKTNKYETREISVKLIEKS